MCAEPHTYVFDDLFLFLFDAHGLSTQLNPEGHLIPRLHQRNDGDLEGVFCDTHTHGHARTHAIPLARQRTR